MNDAVAIQTFVVDLGGVAAHFHPERRMQALALHTSFPEACIQSRLFDSALDHRAELGAYSLDETLEAVLAALDHRLTASQLIEAWAHAFEPDPVVLKSISSLPMRRALFTNNGPLLDVCLAGPLRRVASHFDDVLCSWHLHARKPEPAAFERAAVRLACPPGNLMFLDDTPANVDAARRKGWHAELVLNAEEVAKALQPWLALDAG